MIHDREAKQLTQEKKSKLSHDYISLGPSLACPVKQSLLAQPSYFPYEEFKSMRNW